jgi:hypothetical protein
VEKCFSIQSAPVDRKSKSRAWTQHFSEFKMRINASYSFSKERPKMKKLEVMRTHTGTTNKAPAILNR